MSRPVALAIGASILAHAAAGTYLYFARYEPTFRIGEQPPPTIIDLVRPHVEEPPPPPPPEERRPIEQNVPLVVTGLDDAVVRFSNTRAAEMFKTTIDAFVGKRAPDFYVNPSDRSAFVAALEETNRVDGFAALLRAGDGTTFWSLLNARTLELDGARVFMVGFADLTEQKEIETKLRDLAELDGLTGAFNRRHFFDIAGAALARTASRGKPTCLAMIDADHFKNVNDEYGHAVGDEALKMMTRVARGAARGTDILARYGGEELVLLLTEADVEAAKRVAERIRAGLVSSPVLVPNGAHVTITVSIGVAEHREGESLEALVRRADTSMYEAKRAGRDRVVGAD
jgi:diguanylate cyclase (GGDEF)-like protein/PAS domain S-box-containing protein